MLLRSIKKEDIILYPNEEDKNPELWTDLGDRRRMSLDTFKNLKYRFYIDGDRLKAINSQGDFIANNIVYSPELRNHLEKHPELIIGLKELQILKRNTDKARYPYKYEQGALPIAGPLEYAILGGKSLANGALKSTWNLVKPWAEKAVTDFSNKTNLSYWANNRTGKLGLVLYDSPFGVPTTSKAAVLGDAAIGAVGIDLAAKGLNGSTDSKVNFGLSLLPMTGVATKGATNLYNAVTQVPDYAAQFAKTSKRIIKGFKDPKQWNPTFVGTASRKIFGYNPDKLINFGLARRSYNGKYHDLNFLHPDGYWGNVKNNTERALYDAESNLHAISKVNKGLDNTIKQIKLGENLLISTSLQLRDTQHHIDSKQALRRKADRFKYIYGHMMPFLYRSYNSVNPYLHRVFKPLDTRVLASKKVLSQLYKNYPDIFSNTKYQNPFTSGKISFPIFKTGEIKEFNIPGFKVHSEFDPKILQFKFYSEGPLPQSPKDYQEALRLNNEYIQEIIPGWKPFGSSVLAQNGVPHATHDFDGAISWTDFQKWRDSLSPEDLKYLDESNPGETYAFELNLKKFGDAGHIDINIINPDKMNERSYELFRLFNPDDYEQAGLTLADKSPRSMRRIPFVNKLGKAVTDTQLMNLFDPYTKTVMDAMESFKPKHLARAPLVLLTSDPTKTDAAIKKASYMLHGKNAFTIPESVDMGTPEDRFVALQEIGVPNWMAEFAKNNSQVTKNLINSYLLTNKQLVRLSNAGDIHEDGGSKTKLFRNYLGYLSKPVGGSASGRGTNWILGSHKAFDDRTYVGQLQPSEDLFRITEGTNIRDAVHNILKYFNMSNGVQFHDEDEFIHYMNTPQNIGNTPMKPLGFLGSNYKGSPYFGIGPLDNKKVNLRLFVNRPSYYRSANITNHGDDNNFVPGSFEGVYPNIDFPKSLEFNLSHFAYLRQRNLLNKLKDYINSLREAIFQPTLFKLRGNKTALELENLINSLYTKRQNLEAQQMIDLDNLNRYRGDYVYYSDQAKYIPEEFKFAQEKLKEAQEGVQYLQNREKYQEKSYQHHLNLKRIKDTMLEYKPSSSWPLKMTGVLASPAIVGLDNLIENTTRRRMEKSYEFLNKNKIKYHVSPDFPYLIVYKNENPQITDWEKTDNWPNHILIFNLNK